jgi:hypothetical protein
LILSPVYRSNISVLSVVPYQYLEDAVLLALVLKLCTKVNVTAMSEAISGSGNVSFLNTRNRGRYFPSAGLEREKRLLKTILFFLVISGV